MVRILDFEMNSRSVRKYSFRRTSRCHEKSQKQLFSTEFNQYKQFRISKSSKGDFEDFAKKKEKNLGKTRKKENNISSDEVTGEPLEGNGDFHHKNKKTIYTDPVQRLNPNKGILVNKQTHRDIHKNNINNEEDLNKYIKERRESKQCRGVSAPFVK